MSKYPEGRYAYVTVEKAPERPVEEGSEYRTSNECRTFLGTMMDDGSPTDWHRVDESIGCTYPVKSEGDLDVVMESIRERLKLAIDSLPRQGTSGLRVGVAELYSGD